jgi:hypothetical protein
MKKIYLILILSFLYNEYLVSQVELYRNFQNGANDGIRDLLVVNNHLVAEQYSQSAGSVIYFTDTTNSTWTIDLNGPDGANYYYQYSLGKYAFFVNTWNGSCYVVDTEEQTSTKVISAPDSMLYIVSNCVKTPSGDIVMSINMMSNVSLTEPTQYYFCHISKTNPFNPDFINVDSLLEPGYAGIYLHRFAVSDTHILFLNMASQNDNIYSINLADHSIQLFAPYADGIIWTTDQPVFASLSDRLFIQRNGETYATDGINQLQLVPDFPELPSSVFPYSDSVFIHFKDAGIEHYSLSDLAGSTLCSECSGTSIKWKRLGQKTILALNKTSSLNFGSELVYWNDESHFTRLFDCNSLNCSGNIRGLCVASDKLFFEVDYSDKTELWWTDGTPLGTAKVETGDFDFSCFCRLIAWNGDLYFMGDTQQTGRELFRLKISELIYPTDPLTLIEDFEAYPNPASGSIILKWPQSIEATTLSLFNSQGKLLTNEQILTLYPNSMSYNLELLPPGMYVFEIKGKESKFVKVIKD